MPVNLSVKNVPDALAERLRERAHRNRRSLQRELLTILEGVADEPSAPSRGVEPARGALTLAQVGESIVNLAIYFTISTIILPLGTLWVLSRLSSALFSNRSP